MKEFTAQLALAASKKIFPQNTLSSFKNFFKEKFNLEGDWRVARSKIIFPAKVNQVNKKDLKILRPEVTREKIFFDAV